MVLALSLIGTWSNGFVVLLSVVILLFLLRSIQIKNRFWQASFVAAILVCLISIAHVVAYYSLLDRLRDREAAIEQMKSDYGKLKSETSAARSNYEESKNGVKSSQEDFVVLRQRLNTEFEKAVRDIRAVYADISDEELDRRANNAVRKARQTLQKNVFR